MPPTHPGSKWSPGRCVPGPPASGAPRFPVPQHICNPRTPLPVVHPPKRHRSPRPHQSQSSGGGGGRVLNKQGGGVGPPVQKVSPRKPPEKIWWELEKSPKKSRFFLALYFEKLPNHTPKNNLCLALEIFLVLGHPCAKTNVHLMPWGVDFTSLNVLVGVDTPTSAWECCRLHNCGKGCMLVSDALRPRPPQYRTTQLPNGAGIHAVSPTSLSPSPFAADSPLCG